MRTKWHFNFWAVVKPSKAIPGEWIAHSLEFDVVSQGSSPQHALDMMAEATFMVLTHDLENKLKVSRRRAPEKFFEELNRIIEHGEPIAGQSLDEAGKGNVMFCVPVFMIIKQEIASETASSKDNIVQIGSTKFHVPQVAVACVQAEAAQ